MSSWLSRGNWLTVSKILFLSHNDYVVSSNGFSCRNLRLIYRLKWKIIKPEGFLILCSLWSVVIILGGSGDRRDTPYSTVVNWQTDPSDNDIPVDESVLTPSGSTISGLKWTSQTTLFTLTSFRSYRCWVRKVDDWLYGSEVNLDSGLSRRRDSVSISHICFLVSRNVDLS